MVASFGSRSIVVSSRARPRAFARAGVIATALAVSSLLAPLAARAQQAADPAPGITVVGYGEASAPAETADLQIVVSTVNFGNPVSPDPDSIPGEAERKSVGPLVEALVAAGIPEDDVSVVVSLVSNQYYGPGGPGSTRVDVTVDEATTERIDELVSAAVVGAAEENLVVAQVGVGYGVADCGALEREAREAAFADAEERADLQAEVIGVARGGVVASSDAPVGTSSFDPYAGLSSAQRPCAPPTPASALGASVSFPAYDPTGEAEVDVYAQVSVTFAIEGSAADATPTA